MEREITFDGFDGPDLVCPFINIWKGRDKSKDREKIATAIHGKKGVLLERRGDDCKVRIKRKHRKSRTGWVTFWFIKELKGKWQEGRT